jgi:hypothetical protein
VLVVIGSYVGSVGGSRQVALVGQGGDVAMRRWLASRWRVGNGVLVVSVGMRSPVRQC